MKETELRIGNFVTIDNEEFHPEIKNVPLEVTQILQCESLIRGIWTHSVSLEFINKKKNVYYEDFGQFIKYIEPIPLTEEWLLKFGFKKVKDTWITIESFHYENKNCWIYLIENGFEFELIKLSERHNLCKTYKFVHELQNIYFAITGEELIIKI